MPFDTEIAARSIFTRNCAGRGSGVPRQRWQAIRFVVNGNGHHQELKDDANRRWNHSVQYIQFQRKIARVDIGVAKQR